jgi:hypothetical protein
MAGLAWSTACSTGAKKGTGGQPVRQPPAASKLPSKASGIYGVPVPVSAVLDRGAGPPGGETYRVQGVDLTAFYDTKMARGRPFNGLDFCGRRVARFQPPPAPPVPELVWRKPGTRDLLLVGVSPATNAVTIVDDRNDPKPPCPDRATRP